jgi:hypothetical protein
MGFRFLRDGCHRPGLDGRIKMAYRLEGSSLEACTCEGGCPCWAGHENDGCGTVLSWHIGNGTIEGIDVSGRAVALAADTPCSGVADRGAARATLYVDDEATPKQEEALLNAWTGRLGGPVADLAQLFGEVNGAERAPITFSAGGGKGMLAIGREIKADTAPLWEAEGRGHTIHGNALSAGSGYTVEWSEDPPSQEYNAVQVSFRFEA